MEISCVNCKMGMLIIQNITGGKKAHAQYSCPGCHQTVEIFTEDRESTEQKNRELLLRCQELEQELDQ